MPVTKQKRTSAAATQTKAKGGKSVGSDVWITDDAVDGMRKKKGGRSVCHLNDFDDLEENGELCSTVDSWSPSSEEYLFAPSASSSNDDGAVGCAKRVALTKKSGGATRQRGGKRAPPQDGYDKHNQGNSHKTEESKTRVESKKVDGNGCHGGEFRIVDEEARKKRKSIEQPQSDPPKNLSRRMSYKVHHPRYSPLVSPIHAVKLAFSPPKPSDYEREGFDRCEFQKKSSTRKDKKSSGEKKTGKGQARRGEKKQFYHAAKRR